jgi:hypothetical protein
MKKLIFLASIAITITSCSLGPQKFPDFSTTEGKNDFAQKASVISQYFVKQNLKSPSTANFPFNNYSWSDPNETNKSIIIKSYVDAQNEFGGLIRNTYVINIKYKGGDWSDTNNWDMIDIKFVNQ